MQAWHAELWRTETIWKCQQGSVSCSKCPSSGTQNDFWILFFLQPSKIIVPPICSLSLFFHQRVWYIYISYRNSLVGFHFEMKYDMENTDFYWVASPYWASGSNSHRYYSFPTRTSSLLSALGIRDNYLHPILHIILYNMVT